MNKNEGLSTLESKKNGDALKNNKELALMEIHRKYGHNIREFSKKLRLDKEIIEEHWKKVYKDPSNIGPFCSVIGVDKFGNYIIDKFKNNLKKFLKWLCHKFSYPCEDDLIRDFNKETYFNIDFEKQLDTSHFQKEDNEIDFEM